MSRKKELVKNTAILSLATFLPKAVSVLITPILTSQLIKAEVGQYDLITTFVSLLLPVATLQISSAAFRFLIDRRDSKEECSTIISTIYVFVITAAICVCTLFYFLYARNQFGSNALLVCLYFMADLLQISTMQMLRGLGKNLLYSIGSIIRSVSNVVLLALLTGVIKGMDNYGLSGVLVAMTISTFGTFVFQVFNSKIFRFFKIRSISFTQLKALLNYSWPMVPNGLSMWVLRLSDRLVITAVLGIEANAIYAVANKLPSVFSAFQSTFSLAWQENASIANKDSDKDDYYSQMFEWIFCLLTGVMACVITVTPILWRLLVRGDYNEAYYQLPVLYMGMIFQSMSSTLGGIYIAHMRTKSIGITTIMAAAINLSIDLLFVRVIGIWAGSISTMVAYIFLCVFRMINVQKFQKMRFPIKKIGLSVLLLSIMGLLCFQKKVIFNLINACVCIIVVLIFDRKIIGTLFKALRNKIKKSVH